MRSFRQKGDFSKLTHFLERAKESVRIGDLDKYGREGVAALSSATPIDSGKTANSWSYEITNKDGSATITFKNSNIQNGVPIAIILQYGHGTRNGGWVRGRDYINPAIQPIFDEIVNNAWREVTKILVNKLTNELSRCSLTIDSLRVMSKLVCQHLKS